MTKVPTLAEVTAKLDSRDKEIIERLGDWFESESDLLEAIGSESDKLDDALSEYADGEVSVYASERYEWAASHVGEVAEYEREAVAASDGSVEKALAYCWYESEMNEARQAVERVQNLLEEMANAND